MCECLYVSKPFHASRGATVEAYHGLLWLFLFKTEEDLYRTFTTFELLRHFFQIRAVNLSLINKFSLIGMLKRS
jgi:hypothetical protein